MKATAVRGLKWSFYQQIFTQIVNYVSIIILAKLIEPNIHGLITIVSIPVGFMGVLGSFGVREKILLEKHLTPEYSKRLFGFILLCSILVFFVTIMLVFAIGFLYMKNFEYNDLIKYGFLLSVISPIGVFNHYFESYQTRDLNFKTLSILHIFSIIVGVCSSIVLAYLKFYHLSLTAKLILPHFFFLFFYLIYFKPSLKFSFDLNMYKINRGFTSYLTLNNIANYFVRNVDYLIIGKVFSADVLGQYSIAYKILLFPMKNITSRIQNVMTPIICRLNIESKEFKIKYFYIVSVLAFLNFPIMAILGVTSDIWVGLVFDNKYNMLVDMVMILAVVGSFQSLISPVGILFLLKDKAKLMFFNSLIIAMITTLVYYFSSLTFNIHFVLISFVFSWVLLIMPITIFKIFKIYGFSIFEFFQIIATPLLSSLLSLIVYLFAQKIIPLDNFVIQTVISCSLFSLFYFIAYYFINKNESYSLWSYYQIVK